LLMELECKFLRVIEETVADNTEIASVAETGDTPADAAENA
jgi:exoribonuclease II